MDRLIASRLADVLTIVDAPEVTREQLLRVHAGDYIDRIEAQIPAQGYASLDPDTIVSPGSLAAARHAAGAAVAAVDAVMTDETDNAFCCVRPPGHHAERGRAMGFCLYNNIAVGAAHALDAHGLSRVAIIDFFRNWPPMSNQFSPEQLESWMKSAGFERVAKHDFIEDQYLLIFQRS